MELCLRKDCQWEGVGVEMGGLKLYVWHHFLSRPPSKCDWLASCSFHHTFSTTVDHILSGTVSQNKHFLLQTALCQDILSQHKKKNPYTGPSIQTLRRSPQTLCEIVKVYYCFEQGNYYKYAESLGQFTV